MRILYDPAFETASVCALGAVVAWVAWRPPDYFAALWLLPLGWGLLRRPRGRTVLMGTYLIVALYPVARTMAAFYPHAPAWHAAAVWLACAVALGLPYWLGARSRRHPGLGWILAVIVTAVPPLGVIGMVSPLFAAASAFPGTGLWGLAAAVAAQGLLAGLASRWSVRYPVVVRSGLRAHGPTALLAIFASLALVLNGAWASATAPSAPAHWRSLSTHLGRSPRSARAWLHRQLVVRAKVRRNLSDLPSGTVLLLPENIAAGWGPLSTLAWSGVAREARARGDTVLLGAVLPVHGGTRLDALLMLGRYRGLISARQPIPIGEWRPFSAKSYRTAWWRLGPSYVGPTPVSVIVCYEQLLIWPAVWSWLHGPAPALILAPANHGWAGAYPQEAAIQRHATQALGRLFGVPVLRADNGPSGA